MVNVGYGSNRPIAALKKNIIDYYYLLLLPVFVFLTP